MLLSTDPRWAAEGNEDESLVAEFGSRRADNSDSTVSGCPGANFSKRGLSNLLEMGNGFDVDRNGAGVQGWLGDWRDH